MKQLSHIEAERVGAVLDETITKLRLLKCVPSKRVQSALSDLSRNGAGELAGIVNSVWHLESEKSWIE